MLFQNHRKLKFRLFKDQEWFKSWHKKKTKCVWYIGSYSTHWEPNHTTLELRSHVVLLGTQLMEYGLIHHTLLSPNTWSIGQHLCLSLLVRSYTWRNVYLLLIISPHKPWLLPLVITVVLFAIVPITYWIVERKSKSIHGAMDLT